MKRAIIGATAVVLAGLIPERGSAAIPALYRSAVTVLHTSAVPVLVPLDIPQVFGNVRSVAVIDAGSTGYYLGFSTLARCAGALSCSAFHIAGTPAPSGRKAMQQGDRAVRLSDGARGIYRHSDCSGASCTEASLTFERGSASYEIDSKAGRNTLTALESLYMNLRLLHCKEHDRRGAAKTGRTER